MIRLAAALLFSFFLVSCSHLRDERVRGNGKVKTETRASGNFNSIEVRGNLDAYLRMDSARSVRVEADENLMEYIEVIMEGDHLVVRPREGYNLKGSRAIRIFIAGPVFHSLDASGASKLVSENRLVSGQSIDIDLSGASDAELDVKAPEINASLSGASHVTLTGETRDLDVEGSGASHAKCFGLLSENAEVSVSGASDAELFASVKINAVATGASDVRYKGNAAVSQSVSGAGSVKKAE